MKWCIYDNPVTMCRETWEDGKVAFSRSAELISSKSYDRMGETPFNAGKILGDKRAIAKDQRPQS